MSKPKDAFLVADKMVLSKSKVTNIHVALVAAYYVFNIHYTPGCSNFFSFLETYLLGHKAPRKTRLGNFLAQLKCDC